MTEPTQDSAAASATALLGHYGFELAGYTPQELVARWISNYQAIWVRLAVIEALYQGRYKAVSVEQILSSWSRRGRPLYHFNHEFERLICRKFPYVTVGTDAPVVSESNPPSLSSFTLSPSFLTEEISRPEVNSITPALVESAETSINLESFESEPVSNTVAESTSEPTSPIEEVNESSSADLRHQADWSRWEASKRPINQFTPSTDVSDFYLKLKAVSRQPEELSNDAITPANSEQSTEP